MQAFLIDLSEQRVSTVEIDDGLQGIRRLISFDSVDADEIDSNGDRLHFDESCFIRQQPGAGRFKGTTWHRWPAAVSWSAATPTARD